MIDLKRLRENTAEIKDLILKKEPSFDVNRLIELDAQVREIQAILEHLRKEKNDLASKGAKGITSGLRAQSIEIGKQLKEKEKKFVNLKQEFDSLLLSCPNILHKDVPAGNKESNKVIKEVGQKKNFDFEPKNHIELNEKLQWFDLKKAADITGANFVLYKKLGVKLIYALTRLMIKNNVEHGFQPVLPPYLCTKESLVNSGNLPKFAGDFYEMQDDLCLIPTAEVSLTNLHKKEILDSAVLPLRYCAWTSCFRREAGGYGATDRGLIRIHQFEKVEIYSLCDPETSQDEQLKMLACSEKILQDLGLHYRVSLLAAQDCSFSSAKTYDIEVWLPGQKEYYEVSSCSNCTDFQARRAKIRYRINKDTKPCFVHTLNSSSLALPRLIVALMENYQQADGTIKLPQLLKLAVENVW
jgi:seryl-tRNA synthetase